MKRIPVWVTILILLSLVACNLPSGLRQTNGPESTATLSPDQVQTQINQLLTLMPTNTEAPEGEATATQALPTLPVEAPAEETPAQVVTATPSPTPEATATPAETEPAPTEALPTPTEAVATQEAPTATATTSGLPTVAITPLIPTATLPPAGPTFTPAPGDPRSRLGSPSSTDPMDNPNTWIWPTGTDQFTTTSFSDGRQHITALTGTDGWRMANPLGREFGNLYLEASFRTATCSGTDHYGLIFRVPVLREPDQGYLFGFTCDGRYSLRRWNSRVGERGEMRWLVNWTSSDAIAAGSNQANRMGVMMVGSRILLYANGRLLTEVQDTTFPSGYFGVFVGSDVTDRFTIQVEEMAYWENPQP